MQVEPRRAEKQGGAEARGGFVEGEWGAAHVFGRFLVLEPEQRSEVRIRSGFRFKAGEERQGPGGAGQAQHRGTGGPQFTEELKQGSGRRGGGGGHGG